VSVHHASSPNVSNRKIARPFSSRVFAFSTIVLSVASALTTAALGATPVSTAGAVWE